jgi:hypothetical protein
MAEFPSKESYHLFQQSVRHRSRYVHDDDVRGFLKTLLETSKSRSKTLEKGELLWRAQRGCEWRIEDAGTGAEQEVPCGLSPDRMNPKAEYVGDGRVNPRGIRVLYLTSNSATAVAEVRPWVGAYVSLAQFKVMRDCEVIDCSMDKTRSWHFVFQKGEPDAENREQAVWGDLSHALSRPVTPEEPSTEYIATQIVAEAFRAYGYDGILYGSLLGNGMNLALFDIKAAELINCGLQEVTHVAYTFDQADNPYFIPKHYPEAKKGAVESATSPEK